MNDGTKVIVLCCEGIYQRYLIQRIAEEYQLAGVIIRENQQAKGSLWQRIIRHVNPVEFIKHLIARLLLHQDKFQTDSLVKRLFYIDNKEPSIPDNVPLLIVEDINEPAAVIFVKNLSPDIVCVNGTNLLRGPMLDLIPSIQYGIVNLHTGLSPYSRGGNCNLFALLEGHPEWVGITIHHIGPGIDSGDIIITAQVDMEAEDTYEVIDVKTFRLGIDMLLVAIRQLTEGRAERVKQWEDGKLFLKRTGYIYHPYLHVRVNRMIKKGLLSRYLKNKKQTDRNIRLVGRQN